MYIAMNRFQVRRGYEAEFERIWRERESKLAGTPGFLEFRMLRGPQFDAYTLYASHTMWRDRESFEAWTRSEAFRQAHASAGDHKHIYLDSPKFEGFETVDDIG